MVALKLDVSLPLVGGVSVKQERRGGIETRVIIDDNLAVLE